MSCVAPPQVQLTVSPLPVLGEDKLLCLFGDSPAHPARVEGDSVVCNSPSNIPSTPPGQGEARALALLPPLHTAGTFLGPNVAGGGGGRGGGTCQGAAGQRRPEPGCAPWPLLALFVRLPTTQCQALGSGVCRPPTPAPASFTRARLSPGAGCKSGPGQVPSLCP